MTAREKAPAEPLPTYVGALGSSVVSTEVLDAALAGTQTDDGAAVNAAPSSPDRIEAVAAVMARLHYGDETWRAMSDNGREHAVSLWMTNHPIPDIIAALDAYDREHTWHGMYVAWEADLRERIAAFDVIGQCRHPRRVPRDACPECQQIAARIVRGKS